MPDPNAPPPAADTTKAPPASAAPLSGADGGGATTPPARPDWAPEKFWDAEKGALKAEDLARAHADLGTRFAQGKAGIAEEVRAETLAELRKGVPEAPDGYQVAATKDGVPDDLVLLDAQPGADFVPEEGKRYFLLDPKSPLMTWWKGVAHEAGLSQEKFQAAIVQFAQAQAQPTPTKAEMAEQNARFYASLGDNGQKRVAHLCGQLKGVVGAEAMPVLDAFVEFGGKAAVETLEKLVEKAGGPRFAPGGAGAPETLTKADLIKLQDSPEYRAGDKATVKRVEDGYARLYPSQKRA